MQLVPTCLRNLSWEESVSVTEATAVRRDSEDVSPTVTRLGKLSELDQFQLLKKHLGWFMKIKYINIKLAITYTKCANEILISELRRKWKAKRVFSSANMWISLLLNLQTTRCNYSKWVEIWKVITLMYK